MLWCCHSACNKPAELPVEPPAKAPGVFFDLEATKVQPEDNGANPATPAAAKEGAVTEAVGEKAEVAVAAVPSPAAAHSGAAEDAEQVDLLDKGAILLLNVDPSASVALKKSLKVAPAASRRGFFGTTSGKPVQRANSSERFHGAEEQVPAIGGIVDLSKPHSPFLLPPEVCLFEPTEHEVFAGGRAAAEAAWAQASTHRGTTKGVRQIFLNTPLAEMEVEALRDLRKAVKEKTGANDFPEYMGLHALRMLQQNKYDTGKTLTMMQTFVKERVQRLPIAEETVLEDLRQGFMYWHGRDRKGRPCLVIRVERIGALIKDQERAVRLVLFVLEYGVRYAMVPGRVENWVVIFDLNNAMAQVSPWSIGSMISTAMVLATALETVYCGRMVFMRIVNMPGSALITKAVNSCIPEEKKHKVGFPAPEEIQAEFAKYFEPNQLEARYGGTAPDLAAEDTYPFKFFANCTGKAGDASETLSVHAMATRRFHEGTLWDTSSKEVVGRWLPQAQASSLTPAAAEALSSQLKEKVDACRDMDALREILAPSKAIRRKLSRWPTNFNLSPWSRGK